MRIPLVRREESEEGAEEPGKSPADDEGEAGADEPLDGGAYEGESNDPGAAEDGLPSDCFRHMEPSSGISP
jgi:hypothetical protein